MDERIKSLVEIIERLETRINAYWNFYIIVVLASIGWLMSTKIPFTTNQGIALTIALSMYFIANYFVIRTATKRVIAFEDELNLVSKKIETTSSVLKSELSNTSIRYRLFANGVLHGVLDIAVIFAIWSKLS
jgi:hypothetical protein